MNDEPAWIGVMGHLCPPAGRRSTWLVFVPSCPACGYSHSHRAEQFSHQYVRAPSCSPWRLYLIHARIVLPQAVAA